MLIFQHEQSSKAEGDKKPFLNTKHTLRVFSYHMTIFSYSIIVVRVLAPTYYRSIFLAFNFFGFAFELKIAFGKPYRQADIEVNIYHCTTTIEGRSYIKHFLTRDLTSRIGKCPNRTKNKR